MGFPLGSLRASGSEAFTRRHDATGIRDASLLGNSKTKLRNYERKGPERQGANGRGGVVVVRKNLFELEVDKVVGIDGTLLLLWFVLIEIPVNPSGGENAGAEEDDRKIAPGLFWDSGSIPTDSSSLEYMRQETQQSS